MNTTTAPIKGFQPPTFLPTSLPAVFVPKLFILFLTITETYTFEQNSIYDIGGRRVRTTEIDLDADLTVQWGQVTEESFCGTAYLEINRHETGYHIYQRAEDDYETNYDIATIPLQLDISYLMTSPLCADFTQTERLALALLPSIELSRIAIAHVSIEESNIGGTDGRATRIKSIRGKQTVDGVYQWQKDGQLHQYQYGWSQFIRNQ
ncbi:MAG: hypothetical protein AAF639_28470 [Chloroflexota bacterium]